MDDSHHFVVLYRSMERGFFASLFDVSFTSFITTKIIKVLYILALVGIGLTMLLFVVAGFHESAAAGLLVLLIGAPLGGLLYTIYTRVLLEFIVQVFRITELLRDQTELQRAAFAGGGWPAPGGGAQPAAAAAPTPIPAPSATTPATCPHCGRPTTPGAHFCKSCGQPLS
jgi:Domain of unknown function (DUF4282)/Double zinc ribbon